MSKRIKDFIDTQLAFFRFLYKPMKGILTPILRTILYGVMGYSLGWLLTFTPSIETILNNGFYIMGINSQFRFADLFGTLGFITSYVSGILFSNYERGSKEVVEKKSRSIQPLSEKEVYEAKVNIEDLDGNLALLTLAQEKLLQKNDVLDMYQLSKLKIIELQNMLGISPTLANQIIEEADQVLTQWRREGLI